MKNATFILLFGIVLGTYLLTPIRNRLEAEDAYSYALQVEEASASPSPMHRHHMLFIPMLRQGFGLAKGMGYSGRAHGFMVAISALSGAGSVVLLGLLCRNRLLMSPAASLLTAGMLAAAYGFWRYACEAEIYVPASFLALLTAYLASSSELRARGACVAGLMAGLGVLVHIMNALPGLLVGPLLIAARRRAALLGLYLVLAVGPVAGVYALGAGPGPADSGFWLHRLVEPATYLKGAIGWGQSLASGNYLFAVPAFREQLLQLFPHRMLAEEQMMAEAIPPALLWCSWLSAAGLIAVSLRLLWVRLLPGEVRSEDRTPALEARRWGGGLAGLWFAIYAFTVLIFEPGNPEMWVMALPPFFLVFGCFLVEPVVRARGPGLPTFLLAVLIVHNLVGGIAPLAGETGDYNACHAAWMVEHGEDEDTVFTAGSAVFTRYLRYHTAARVLALNEMTSREMEESLAAARGMDGRVYALGDIFDQPVARSVRAPEAYSNVAAFAESHRPEFEIVTTNAPGGVYVLPGSRASPVPSF